MAGTLVGSVKSALFDAFTGLFPAPTLVSYGDPGEYQPNEIIAVMGSVVPVSRPTASTNRSREEGAETTVIVSVYVPGGQEAQQTATERAYAMVGQMSDYFRAAFNARLGGAAYDSWISEYDDVPSVAVDPATGNATGRVCEITVKILSKSRP